MDHAINWWPIISAAAGAIFATGGAYATMRLAIRKLEADVMRIAAEIGEDFENLREDNAESLRSIRTEAERSQGRVTALEGRVAAHDMHLGILAEKLNGLRDGLIQVRTEQKEAFLRLENKLDGLR